MHRRKLIAALSLALLVNVMPIFPVYAEDGNTQTEEQHEEKKEAPAPKKEAEPAPAPAPAPEPAPAQEPVPEQKKEVPQLAASLSEDVPEDVPAQEPVQEDVGNQGSEGGSEDAQQPQEGGNSEEPQGEGGEQPVQGDTDSGQEDPSEGGENDPVPAEAGDNGEGGETDPSAPAEPKPEIKEEEKTPEEKAAEESKPEVKEEETKTDRDKPEGYDAVSEHHGTNAALIAEQMIVHIPVPEEDFRLYSADGKKCVTKGDTYIYSSRSENGKKAAAVTGHIAMYELERKDGWSYVETEHVRGFIRSSDVIFGNAAEDLLKEDRQRMTDAVKKSISVPEEERGEFAADLKESISKLEVLIPWNENEAFCYMRGTSLDHIRNTEGAYAIRDTFIFEKADRDSRHVGELSSGCGMYILEDVGDFYFVESGDVRGYAYKPHLCLDDGMAKRLTNGDRAVKTAKELVSWKENKATFDYITSAREGSKTNPVRKKIVELAAKSLGCPYVWGGTDLYEGADCSGFVQSLYRRFGYNIPRVAEAQSQYGTKIPVEDAMPGDLIFFADNGYVYHVAMYIGEGKTIEAYSSDYGIIVHHVSGRDTVWATRVIED